MAENDIYNSKKHYEGIVQKINSGAYLKAGKKSKYVVKNPANLDYLKRLIKEFEYKDISYIRRIDILKSVRKTAAMTEKDFKDLTRDDVKTIITKLNKSHKTLNTRRDYVNHNKAAWKIFLPEKDHQGRQDDTVVPYAWRVKVHTDPSLKKDKSDKFTDTEYVKILRSLGKDPRMQTYFSLIYECLARPQELCYVNIEDIDLRDQYARIRIKAHGKEGTKTLQIIDGYYYLAMWLNQHPLRDNPQAPLFITLSNNQEPQRLQPKTANILLRRKLDELGIKKRLTNYSFKRNGVTSRYVAGESAQNIQKIAGWTSTDQLKTYDLSEQEEFFELELKNKGIIADDTKNREKYVTYKLCAFCNTINPKTNENCSSCARPLDRDKIIQEEQEKEAERNKLSEELKQVKAQMTTMPQQILEALGLDAETLKQAIELKKAQNGRTENEKNT